MLGQVHWFYFLRSDYDRLAPHVRSLTFKRPKMWWCPKNMFSVEKRVSLLEMRFKELLSKFSHWYDQHKKRTIGSFWDTFPEISHSRGVAMDFFEGMRLKINISIYEKRPISLINFALMILSSSCSRVESVKNPQTPVWKKDNGG